MQPITTRTEGLPAPRSASQQSLGQADFLRLLTTQLTNQSPLDPMDNEAFVAQMAQFSAVSGIGEMNQSLQALRDELGSRRLSDAASYIGRLAFVPSAPVAGPVAGVVDLPKAADALNVEIVDAAGRPIRTLALGPQAAGEVHFGWDGKDVAGAPAGGGPFRLVAAAMNGGVRTETPLYLAGRVNAVSAQNGVLTLDVEGHGRLPPASVFKLT
jgi:flagellar basal-body rod modification protein FlgD